jgi:hypothetical protein
MVRTSRALPSTTAGKATLRTTWCDSRNLKRQHDTEYLSSVMQGSRDLIQGVMLKRLVQCDVSESEHRIIGRSANPDRRTSD